MSWGPSKKRYAQFAVLAFLAGEVSYLSAQVLVLRSVGPSARNYPAGQRLPDSASFTLRPGDSVVILAGGATRTFRGPGTFSSTGPVRAGGLASAQVRRTTGAVRGSGPSEVLRPKDIWQIDVTQSGRACVPAGARPSLWRPNSDQTVQVTITPQTGTPQTLDWSKGQSTLEWPASVALVDGDSYQISWTGGASPTRLTARTIAPLAGGDVEGTASALLENQCRSQLDVLIAEREAGADQPTTPGAATASRTDGAETR